MNLFRNLLFWIVLALVGALVAQLLVQDPGYVLVRYRGMDYTTTLAAAVLIGLGALLALWLVWKMFTLPFQTLRRRRERAARARFVDGLDALELGHWTRAEKLLGETARAPDPESDGVAKLASLGAARAAASRGDAAQAHQYLDTLGGTHPASRAVVSAELALAAGKPAEALALLDAPNVQPLPPRGLALRAHALAALDRAGDAYALLGPMRQQQALPPARLDALERDWAQAACARPPTPTCSPIAGNHCRHRCGPIRSPWPPMPNVPRRCAGKKPRPGAWKPPWTNAGTNRSPRCMAGCRSAGSTRGWNVRKAGWTPTPPVRACC